MIFYLSLGTNLGEKEENLRTAISFLSEKVKVLKESKIYKSSPMGPQDQDHFLNMAIKIETDLEPLDLLKFVKEIEERMGRQKTVKWGPRVIDIDILFKGSGERLAISGKQKLNLENILTIPHKGLLERDFFLVPLHEIADLNMLEDFYGKSFDEILDGVRYKVIDPGQARMT